MSRALGRYELLRPLARGGMGEVYLARRRAAGVEKWLVVKRMRPERAGDARFLDLFMREARLSMSLAHQNIVPVFDFGRIDDQVFLAMERVEGKDLGSTITKASKGMPPLLAAFIAAECCQALDYAHRRKGPDGADLGIVHRDVTPRNVLLSWSGEVKLTDFGIAALAGDTEAGKTAGTPAYMAPEQARGEPTDVRADIYAVGMVLREALTGERGRRGNDRETILAVAKTGALDPWPEGVELALRPIIDRATHATASERYPDARAMLADLDEFIVAERAARKGEAPARQLSAWLAEVWEGERDDVTISDVDIEAKHMMSFLDDGAFDVVGTGTQRSMAMTAAESKPSLEQPAPAPAPEPRAVSQTDASVRMATAPPVAQKRTSRVWLVLLAGLVGAGSVALVMRKPDAPARVVDPPIATATADAQEPIVEQQTVDAIAVVPPAPVDAGVADAAPRVKPRTTTTTVKTHEDKQVVTPPVPVAKYKVTINSTPWSYFTVDNDATKHATMANLELAPGPHTLHFTGSDTYPADKTVTIVVPEKDGFKFSQRLNEPTPAP